MSSKLKSRRFWVWITWTLIVVLEIIYTKSVNPVSIAWYGTISSLYIGSSVAKSLIFKNKGE